MKTNQKLLWEEEAGAAAKAVFPSKERENETRTDRIDGPRRPIDCVARAQRHSLYDPH